MTEEIQKAARLYSDEALAKTCAYTDRTYERRRTMNLFDASNIEQAFKDGAEWADKHPIKKQEVWHNAETTPKENSKIVLIDEYGEWYNISYSFDEYDDVFGKGWESCVRTYNIDKWAYLDDLINL